MSGTETHASAFWRGSLREGQGSISTGSGSLDHAPFTFGTRFEGAPGTNPEELIGAAEAACFSMALGAKLGEAGFKPEHIATSAKVTLDKDGAGFAITSIHLDVKAKVPGIAPQQFEDIALDTKANCPVSKALNVKISLNANLDA